MHDRLRDMNDPMLNNLFEDSDDDELFEQIVSEDDDESNAVLIKKESLESYPEVASCSLDSQDEAVFTRNTYLCDTGASCHFTNSLEGMTHLKKHKGNIKIGNGKPLKATMIGNKHVTAIQKDGTTQDLILTECNYVPELWVNLFSIGKALKNGFSLTNKGVIITVTKNNTKLCFDRIFKTGKGFVAGVNLIPKTVKENALLGLESKKMTVNAAHNCMTHVGEEATRLTAKHYGLTVSGKMEPCTHCGMAKARQSNLLKTTNVKSKIKGERIFIDLSWTQKPSYGGTRFWL